MKCVWGKCDIEFSYTFFFLYFATNTKEQNKKKVEISSSAMDSLNFWAPCKKNLSGTVSVQPSVWIPILKRLYNELLQHHRIRWPFAASACASGRLYISFVFYIQVLMVAFAAQVKLPLKEKRESVESSFMFKKNEKLIKKLCCLNLNYCVCIFG